MNRTALHSWLSCLFSTCCVLLCLDARAQPEQGRMVLSTPVPASDSVRILQEVSTASALESDHPDSAQALLAQVLRQSRELHFSYGMALSLRHLGNIALNKGAYAMARALYRESIGYAVLTARGKNELPLLFNATGMSFHMQGEYEDALSFYSKAIAIAERLPGVGNADYTYANMAAVLTQLRQPEEQTFFYLDKAEKAARRSNNHALLGTVLINKGFAHNARKAWDTSRPYFHAALKLARQQDLRDIRYLALINLGITYLEEQLPQKALPYLLQAEQAGRNVYPGYRNIGIRSLGETYQQLKNYPIAEKYLLMALQQARSMQMGVELQDAYRALAALYESKGAYRQAYDYQQLFLVLKDSLENQEITANVSRLEVKYRTVQKDKELVEKQWLIARQEDRLRQQRSWIVLSLAGVMLLVAMSAALWRSNRHRQNLQREKIRSLQQRQEIGQLKAMMSGEEKERSRMARELHDGIGGLLSAVKMQTSVLKKKYGNLEQDQAFGQMVQMLDEMGTEIRKTAHNLMPDALLRYSLPEAIRHFSEPLQQARGLKIDIQDYGDFDQLGYNFRLTVYRMVQELIHNIVKHAEARNAIVQLILYDHTLGITVEDDGKGFDAARSGNGIGLRNLDDRVRSLGGQLAIDTRPGRGTTVYIELENGEDERTNP